MNDDSDIEYVEETVLRLIERRRFDQAKTIIGNALSSDPNNTILLFYSACIGVEQENYDDAETILEEILGLDPGSEEVRLLLASVYKDTKRYVAAEGLMIELIRCNPESPTYLTLYARIMLETLHIDKADKLARMAIKFEPENRSALIVSVLCEVIQSNNAQCQQRLSELVRQYPETLSTAAIVLVVLFEQKKFREALRIAQELLRSDPTNDNTVEMIKELRVLTHPTMIPLWPAVKFGWHASAVLWALAIVFIYVSSRYLTDTATGTIAGVWLLYGLYSWIYPPLLRKMSNYL